MRIRPTARRLATLPLISVVGVALLAGCGKTADPGATPTFAPTGAVLSQTLGAMATN